MANKYLITITELNEDALARDGLTLAGLPETFNDIAEKLAPEGSLDLQEVFLVTAGQRSVVFEALELNSLPFPGYTPTLDDDDDETPYAQVVQLNDRRQRAQKPNDAS